MQTGKERTASAQNISAIEQSLITFYPQLVFQWTAPTANRSFIYVLHAQSGC